MTTINWHETTFGELIEIKHGFAFKGEFFGEAGEHIVLTPGNFHEHGGMKLKGAKEKFYTDVPPDEYVLNRGDLIVAMTDLVQNAPILGSTAFVPESGKFLHNQRLGKITVKRADLVSPEFTFWLFNSYSVRGQIKGSATGSTVRHTSPSRIYEVSVELPPPPTQRKIASILSAYDDLIENNTRRIGILEEMAQAIYREWFVNFRFPGHENVKLVDSPLGQIPEGWEVGVVNDLLKLLSGFAFKSKTFNDDGGYKVVTIKHVHDGEFQTNSMSLLDSPPDRMPAHCHLETADVLMSLTGNIGRTCLVFGENFLLNQRVAKLHPHRPQDRPLVYWMFRSPDTRQRLEQIANGVAQQNLSPVQTGKMDIPIPPVELRDSYAEVASPMIEAILNLNRKNANLRTTRDLLLPKLISGKLDVEDLDIYSGLTAEALEEATA